MIWAATIILIAGGMFFSMATGHASVKYSKHNDFSDAKAAWILLLVSITLIATGVAIRP